MTHYLFINPEEFEALTPMFPPMLTWEDSGVEWDNLTAIAEQTDDPHDWEAVHGMEALCDHQVFEGKW